MKAVYCPYCGPSGTGMGQTSQNMGIETLHQAELWVERYLDWCGFWADFLEDRTVVDGSGSPWRGATRGTRPASSPCRRTSPSSTRRRPCTSTAGTPMRSWSMPLFQPFKFRARF